MNDIISIAEQMNTKIREIDSIRAQIKTRGEEKARTASIYDMEVAKYLIGLKNGKEYELSGEKIKEPPASITEKIAKGLAWEEKLHMDASDANYKSAISNLEAVKSQLNALQSLNRNLD